MGRSSYSERLIVEECRAINIYSFGENACFRNHTIGTLKWTSGMGIDLGQAGFEILTDKETGFLRLQYTATNTLDGDSEVFDYKIGLVSTRCHFGGFRWWFLCPLYTYDKACNRRVGFLYLGRNKYFGCRHCQNLIYRSCKEHDKQIDALLRNPIQLNDYLTNPNLQKQLLALKALTKGGI